MVQVGLALMNKSLFRVVVLVIAVLPFQRAWAQYANNWIDFSKQYFKVTVASDGAFRLTYNDLQNAGFPVAGVDPRRVQLYHRGVEQAIIIQGQADARFDPGDYIEFYGRKNDGTLDGELYRSPDLQPHNYYNLYSDTSAYFLTWNQALVQGKRMAVFSEVNVGGIPKDTYHYNERLVVYSNEYATGNTVGGVLQYTQFDEGEGWTGSTICIGNSGCTGQLDLTINNLSGGVAPGGNPQLEMLLVGRDALNHLSEIYVGPSVGSLRLLTTESFTNYQTRKINLPINWSDISAGGQLTVRVKALGVGGLRDRLSVSYVKITHPQDFNMSSQPSKWFTLETSPAPPNKSYIEIVNPAPGLSIWDVTDEDDIVVIGTTPAGANVSAVVPNTGINRRLFARNNFSGATIKKIGFRQIAPVAHDYLIISNKALMKPALGYADPVKAYGGFRASEEGGMYDTLVVSVDQLYNQFNFGESSPAAIYEFMKFMVENGDPKYLFLIGKGLDVSQGFFRKTTVGPNDFKDLVPSAGMPGSDMAFTAGLDGTTFEPAVPTGRISASNPAHVASYLNKVKEIEALPFNQLWRKDVLHLSGGIQPIELTTFKQYMAKFGDVAKGPYYGGKVTTIGKQEPNPVELINVSEEVNKGVNLITFFGHSSPNTIDIDIGFATDPVLGYNNPGKYPSFLINGCNAGVFFSNSTVFGEDWVLAAGKGARSFIAHSSFGFVSTLRAYTQLFYEVGFGDSTFIRTGLGDIQKEVGRRYFETNSPTIASVTQVQQMVMLGDPALKLFGALKPDYETNDDAIYLESFDGSPVNALADSFAVKVITQNFGSVSKLPFKVKVTRTFSDNTVRTYDSAFASPKSLDTLSFTLRREAGVSGFGSNQFLVELDFDDQIEELNEDNNSGLLNFFIPLSGTKNLLPRPFGIVNSTNVKLKFQNTDLLSDERMYNLEIDTAATFDSPFLQQVELSGKVLMEYDLTLLAADSLAYYWRTKLRDPLPAENKEWTSTSFVYINNGPEGWAQVHFPQLMENPTAGLVKDPVTGKLKFEETEASIFVENYGSSHPSPLPTSFKINNVEYNLSTQGQPCRSNTINLVAFDKTTLVPYAGIPFVFQDPRTCGREPQVINSFRLNELETGNNDDLLKYIDNINPSDSVVMFSISDAGYASWPANVITKLEDLGISNAQLSSLQAGEPIVVLAKKGSVSGTAIVKKTQATPANEQQLVVSETLTGKFTSGSMSSVLVGPADDWRNFRAFTRERSPSDVFSFDIEGINLVGNGTLLFAGVNGAQDLTSVDPALFPLISVTMNTSDELEQSPVQLHQWMVDYTPVAEGVLFFGGTKGPIEREEGAEWVANYSFLNITDKLFSDSLKVQFEVFNKPQRKSEKRAIRISPPSPGDSSRFSFTVDTRQKTGLNDVNVAVNNRIIPEQYYENNVLQLLNYLNVIRDKIIPVLDLTIDGRYVQEGELVSPNPVIVARVWDESRFVKKKDTVGVRLLLKSPCGDEDCEFQSIHFTREDVTWFPATDTSDFKVVFKPNQLAEGEHVLRAEIEDGSGNMPSVDYEVRFNVSLNASVRFDEAYPNPSLGDMFFGFTASGDTAPDAYRLQIFSLDGRTIKSFSGNENLRVGKHELLWDGSDDHGIQQNGGVYLYRFSVSLKGRSYMKSGKLILFR